MSGTNAPRSWQEKAWQFYDTVGELRFMVGWKASAASRVRLIASAVDEDGVPTGGVDEKDAEGQRVAEIVRFMAGGAIGQAQLIRRVVECLSVPGEVWVTILFTDKARQDAKDNAKPGTDPKKLRVIPEWFAVTPEEINASAVKTTIELPDGTKHEFKDNLDGMFRVWNPRPRRAREPDSPVRATMDSLNEIRRTTKTIANASKSRLIGNGVVFVPTEMSLPSLNSPISSNKPGSAPVPPLMGSPAVQQLQELLFQVAQTAYDDEDSMAALIPMFAAAPGELIKNVTHLKFDNEVTKVAIETRNDAIQRCALGWDISPERLMGLGSNSNHWSAWQVGDDDVRLHILPPVELLCQGMTEQVLKKVLRREGIDPNKYVVWHDASQLTIDPDKSEEARDAFDRGAITAEAMVKYLGLADDTVYDFATPDGWAQWARDRVGDDATLLPLVGQMIPELQKYDFQPPAQPAALPPGETDPNAADGEKPSGAKKSKEPNTEDKATKNDSGNGDQKAVVLYERETSFAEAMVFRALEIAGKRRRRMTPLPRELRTLSDRALHSRLPAVPDDHVDELIKGWDTVLDDPVVLGLGLDPDRVREIVRKHAVAELTKVVDA